MKAKKQTGKLSKREAKEAATCQYLDLKYVLNVEWHGVLIPVSIKFERNGYVNQLSNYLYRNWSNSSFASEAGVSRMQSITDDFQNRVIPTLLENKKLKVIMK